jgi:ATP-dependent Zn protease
MRKAERELQKLRATAYHEAGHAVVSLERGHSVQSATIIPNEDDGTLGICQNSRPPKWFKPDEGNGFREQRWIEARVIILMAGMVAEREVCGRNNWVGANHDHQHAVDLASSMYDGAVLDRFVAFMLERTRSLIRGPAIWLKIEATAAALIEQRTLSGKRITQTCRDAVIRT